MLASDHSVGGEKNVPIVKNVLLRKKTFWHAENLMVANILAIKFVKIKILLAERFHSGARLDPSFARDHGGSAPSHSAGV